MIKSITVHENTSNFFGHRDSRVSKLEFLIERKHVETCFRKMMAREDGDVYVHFYDGDVSICVYKNDGSVNMVVQGKNWRDVRDGITSREAKETVLGMM